MCKNTENSKYHIFRQYISQTIPFPATHTRIANIWEYPPGVYLQNTFSSTILKKINGFNNNNVPNLNYRKGMDSGWNLTANMLPHSSTIRLLRMFLETRQETRKAYLWIDNTS